MNIELPDDAIERARNMAQEGEDAQAVILRALDRLEQERQEVAAVMEGVADYEAGRHRPYDEFSKEFMAERGITPDR